MFSPARGAIGVVDGRDADRQVAVVHRAERILELGRAVSRERLEPLGQRLEARVVAELLTQRLTHRVVALERRLGALDHRVVAVGDEADRLALDLGGDRVELRIDRDGEVTVVHRLQALFQVLECAEQLAHPGLQLARRGLLAERRLHLVAQVDERVAEHVTVGLRDDINVEVAVGELAARPRTCS